MNFVSTKLRTILLIGSLFVLLIMNASAFAADGYATRYWDGCKPHCSWSENASGDPVKTCNLYNVDNGDNPDLASSCDGGDAYTCWDMAPKAVSSTLSYGYAAVPATGDVCGQCYEVTFTGTGHYNDDDSGSNALKAANKTMILMATNIGYDVSGGQFDILIPGGGVGAFNACSTQWNVSNSQLGAQYGGFLTACNEELGWNADHDDVKSCVRSSCDEVFSQDGMENLKDGCYWFVDWYEAADNPDLVYSEVTCPTELVDGALTGNLFTVESDSEETTDPEEETDPEGTEPEEETEPEDSVTTLSCSNGTISTWTNGVVINNYAVTNNGTESVATWAINLDFGNEITVVNSWNASASSTDNIVTLSGTNLSAGQTVYFGLQGSYSGDINTPECALVE